MSITSVSGPLGAGVAAANEYRMVVLPRVVSVTASPHVSAAIAAGGIAMVASIATARTMVFEGCISISPLLAHGGRSGERAFEKIAELGDSVALIE